MSGANKSMKRNILILLGFLTAGIIVFVFALFGVFKPKTAVLIGAHNRRELSEKESRVIQQQLPENLSNEYAYKTSGIHNSGLKKNLDKINEINRINSLNKRRGN